MKTPRRGPLTDYYNIQIIWDELIGDETRGGQITSYYL